ncbi:MAG: efflux RND transporter periplasmic adaptor subunit [Fibrobacteria bacterium]|nr:efflux RND transporter periplasmic adaptor subunit [Fibrobacteria bacterium]
MNTHSLRPLLLASLAATAFLGGCRDDVGPGFLSSATIESDLWKISPSTPGTWEKVAVGEGSPVDSGQFLAQVDSIPLVLKRAELQAAQAELQAGIAARSAEHRVLEAAHKGVEREASRATSLVADGAAPSRTSDEMQTQLATSKARLAASRSAIAALKAKGVVLSAQMNSLEDQIRRCTLASPTTGTVTARYRNAGEAAIPGRPVLEIGRTDTLWAEFFVAQPVLSRLKLHQILRLRLDSDTGESWTTARLSWISDEAEFTPKGVQTRASRNELVFRCRALAANPQGILKRGLPVEVWE